jgi:hypothetical protein
LIGQLSWQSVQCQRAAGFVELDLVPEQMLLETDR